MKTRMRVFNVTMFIILTFPFVSCTPSCLLTYSYLYRSNFYKTTCSTDLHDELATPSLKNYFTSPQKMSIQVLEVVRMLLVMSGLETNPGPVSTRSTNTAPPPGIFGKHDTITPVILSPQASRTLAFSAKII